MKNHAGGIFIEKPAHIYEFFPLLPFSFFLTYYATFYPFINSKEKCLSQISLLHFINF